MSLPAGVERTPSFALEATEGTRLGRAIAEGVAANPQKSGIHPLGDGREAFAARMLLAAAAERSLDLQYYIWHGDTTGQLLFDALWQAAERGVRVRLLLDDANTRGLDAEISALDAHANIEVRLFNPFANRRTRLVEAIADFSRINRRMHNKSFIADSQAAVVGGRNVGDEYFGTGSQIDFRDLDVLAVGSVVREVSDAFDRYWNSESAYPAASVSAPAAPDAVGAVVEAWARVRQGESAKRYIELVRDSTLVRELLERRLPLEWTSARIVADDPAKVLGTPELADDVGLALKEALGQPQHELELVSPYFVPGKAGTAALKRFVAGSVQVRVVTNSLAATDVSIVHAGYSKYRASLVRGGVRVYELMPGADARYRKTDHERLGIGSSASTSSLHAKVFAVDRRRLFVGSFNLDPRSAHLNTEMGVVIDSASLAQRLSTRLDELILGDAYEVRVAAGSGALEWAEQSEGGEIVYTHEPQTGWWRRMWTRFLSLLPIEWLL